MRIFKLSQSTIQRRLKILCNRIVFHCVKCFKIKKMRQNINWFDLCFLARGIARHRGGAPKGINLARNLKKNKTKIIYIFTISKNQGINQAIWTRPKLSRYWILVSLRQLWTIVWIFKGYQWQEMFDFLFQSNWERDKTSKFFYNFQSFFVFNKNCFFFCTFLFLLKVIFSILILLL